MSHGYGKDIRLFFNTDGEVDIQISPTGDISIVGGSGEDPIKVKTENVVQQIKIRLFTPYGSATDENGSPIPFGSLINASFQDGGLMGAKINDMTLMLLKSYIVSALSDISALESIVDIRIAEPDKNRPGSLGVEIYFTVKEDTKLYYTTLFFGE